ncbi:MAG: hypothetical protein ACP5OR_02895 [Candidatus Dormibacteria bacterium]
MPRFQYHQPSYRTSQSILSLPSVLTDSHLAVIRAYAAIPEDPTLRQEQGQAILDILNTAHALPACTLVVADRRQVHRRSGARLVQKTYGYYRGIFQNGDFQRGTIRIYHRTAVREQPIAPNVFLTTLFHEWVHHYDYTGLHILRSYHTSGFYSRIRSLTEEILPVTSSQ